MLGVGADDRELVTAKPCDGVGRSQHALQPRSDLLQQRIAAVVAERVVDVLEAIEVEQKDAKHRLVAARAEQRLPQTVAEQRAVGQSGQRIVQRLVLQRVGVRLALGDVAHCRDEEATRPDLRRVDQELEWKQARVLALAHGFEGT